MKVQDPPMSESSTKWDGRFPANDAITKPEPVVPMGHHFSSFAVASAFRGPLTVSGTNV